MRQATVWGIAIATLGLTGCADSSSDSDSAATTTIDVVAILEDSGPFQCTEDLAVVVATMLDTDDLQVAQDAWGLPSPATEFAYDLYGLLVNVRLREGVPVASDQLIEYSTNACFDGDIANDVNRAEPGDEHYVTACLDGAIPSPSDPACVVTRPVDTDATGGGGPPLPTEDAAPTSAPSTEADADSVDVSSTTARTEDESSTPWSGGPVDHPIAEELVGISSSPEFGSCPLLWPLDGPPIEIDGGEGLQDFTTVSLELTETGTTIGYTWAASVDSLSVPLPDLARQLPSAPAEVTYSDGSVLTRVGLGPAWHAVIQPAGVECVYVLSTSPEADAFQDALVAGIRGVRPSP